MKSREEKAYFAYLEKVIREQKAQSRFFHRGSSPYEMDVHMLMEHIAGKNPNLADRIIGNIVDTTSMENCSKQDILAFMGRTEKGTICKWKNENGEEIYLLNNGERFFKKSKQILVFGNRMDKGDLEMLKKSMYGSVLKKDIQKVYEKIEREEQRRQQNKTGSVLETLGAVREKKLENTAGDFERNFKELVKSQGSLCIPQAAAATMISFMDNSEVRKLSESLSHLGVRDSSDFERLIARWKNEALNPEIEYERKYSRKKTRNVEILRGR